MCSGVVRQRSLRQEGGAPGDDLNARDASADGLKAGDLIEVGRWARTLPACCHSLRLNVLIRVDGRDLRSTAAGEGACTDALQADFERNRPSWAPSPRENIDVDVIDLSAEGKTT